MIARRARTASATCLAVVSVLAFPRGADASSSFGTEERPAEPAPSPAAFGPWIEGELGVSSLSLRTLAVDQSRRHAGMEPNGATVPMVGAGAGFRLAIVTLGARARFAMPDRWDLWTAGGELGLRVPVAIFEPSLDLGGGYAAISNVKDASAVEQGIAPVSGYYARVGAGLGVHATRALVIGAHASWEVLALMPHGTTIADLEAIGRKAMAGSTDEAWNDGRKLGGTGYGSALSVTASVSARF